MTENTSASIQRSPKRITSLNVSGKRDEEHRRAAQALSNTDSDFTNSIPTIHVAHSNNNQQYFQEKATIGTFDFDGGYVLALGGYRFGGLRKDGPDLYLNTANVGSSSLSSGNAGFGAGYNFNFNEFLLGLEGRFKAELGQEKNSGSNILASENVSLPFLYRTYLFGTRTFPSSLPAPDFLLSNNTLSKASFSRDYGGDAALRFGMILNDVLIYGRMGGGASAVVRTLSTDRSGVVACVNPISRIDRPAAGVATQTITGCGAFSKGGISTISKSALAPYAVMGGGLEKNFGSIFVRIEGNFYATIVPALSGLSPRTVGFTSEVLGAVGYRF